MRKLYGFLLSLYPREFRQRYAREMIRAFVDGRDAASSVGTLSLVRFLAGSVQDVVLNGAAARFGRRAHGPCLRMESERPSFWAAFAQDAGFAARVIRHTPALSFFTAVTLALAIGSVAAVSGIADAVLIQPLPFPSPGEIVAIRGTNAQGGIGGVSPENVKDIRRNSSTLRAASPFLAQSVNLTGVAEPDRLRGGFVTADFFRVLGIPAALGRVFESNADVPASERVAVLTYRAWQLRFGERRDIIGKTITLNNAPFVVIGVMPRTFDFPIDEVEVFLPLWTTTAGIARGNHNFFVLARLNTGVSVEQSSGEAAAMAASLARTYPDENRGRGAFVQPLHDVLIERQIPSLRLLSALVIAILVAACANVAALQLGSMSARRREFDIRAALGAGQGRITRQLLLESTFRAVLGAAAGVLAAIAALRLLIANAPDGLYGLSHAGVSLLALAVTAAVTLTAGIVSGVPVAWHWSRRPVSRSAGDRTIGDLRGTKFRRGLVIAQIAFAAALLVVTGLTTRSFVRLASVDPGFDGEQLLTMEYRLPRNKYGDARSQVAFHTNVLERIRAIPGVVDAATVRALPFSGNSSTGSFRTSRNGELLTASFNTVSESYFAAMRIPLLSGRVFDSTSGDVPVVIVSHTLAQRAWPGQSAVGRLVFVDGAGVTATVIGVVGDVRHRDLADRDPAGIYAFERQFPGLFNTLAVRTAVSPLALADDVRHAIWSVDPDQPVWKIRTVASLVEGSLAQRRFILQLVIFFGVTAASLAVLGLYGVVATATGQQTREIGVRIALGATRRGVLWMVLSKGLRLSVGGVLAGLALAWPATTALRSFLYEIGARDPLTYVAAAAALVVASLCACWIPAARAVRIDPAVALRN